MEILDQVSTVVCLMQAYIIAAEDQKPELAKSIVEEGQKIDVEGLAYSSDGRAYNKYVVDVSKKFGTVEPA